MTSRAQYIIEQISSVTSEDFSNPADAIKPVLDKVSAIKFKSDEDRKNFIARIEQKFGKEVAELVDKYAGKSVSSYPTSIDSAMKSLITNVNGIIAGNPG